MKTRYGICIILMLFCQLTAESPESLAQQAFAAIQEPNTARFKSIMNGAVARWKKQPQFLKFINSTDQDQWTLLMIAAALDDPERINVILDAIENGLSDNIELQLKAINQRDKNGKTAFYISAEYNNIRALLTLLNKASLIFKNNKPLFLEFLVTPESDFFWSPLMVVSFQSASDAVFAIVEKAIEILGRDSQEFNQFINEPNLYHDTPYSLAIEPWDRLFLERHGAHKVKRPDGVLQEQENMGKQLLHLVKHKGSEQLVKKLLTDFIAKFPNDKRGFIHFISARDDAGWTALMNAAADGNQDFVNIIIDTALDYYKDNPTWIIYLLITTDLHGRTPLHIAVSRKHMHIIKTIMDAQKRVFGNNKKVFEQFINYHDELNGFTPFLKAAYLSENNEFSRNLLILFLKRAEEVFGLNTAWFEHFINFKDSNGYTALTYVMVPSLRQLLHRYGAHDPLKPIAAYATTEDGTIY